jgi:NADPH-dependent 7-cyano-7-deazaguanine reductase QueF-like protein
VIACFEAQTQFQVKQNTSTIGKKTRLCSTYKTVLLLQATRKTELKQLTRELR